MYLLKLLNRKFSIVLTLAITFGALTAFASAQNEIYYSKKLNGVNFGIQSDNSGFFAGSSAAAFQITGNAAAHPGGVNVMFGDGSVRFSVAVSEVMLPNSPLEYDRVDAQDPNAATKIKMLIDAALRMNSKIVLTIPKDSINVPRKFRTAQLTVEGDKKSRYEVKMMDVLITSYNSSSVSGISLVSIKFSSLR